MGYDTGNGDDGNFGLHLGCGQATFAPANTIVNNQFALMSTLVKSSGTPPDNVAIYKNGIPQPLVVNGPGGCLPSHVGWLAPGEYSTGLAALDIGARDDMGTGSFGSYHNGDIGEILVYQGTLSDTDRQAVEHYLGLRFGIDTTPPPIVLVDERCVKIRYSSAAVEFTLEETSSLNPANWGAVTPAPVVVGNSFEAIIPHVGTKYYRLRKP